MLTRRIETRIFESLGTVNLTNGAYYTGNLDRKGISEGPKRRICRIGGATSSTQ